MNSLRLIKPGKMVFVVVHLILLACFSYIIADLIGFFVGERFVVHSKLKETPSLSRPLLKRPSHQFSKIIIEGNIFNREQRGQTPQEEFPVFLIPPDLDLLPLKIRLMGTIVGEDPGNTYAVIQDEVTKKQELFRLNELVMEEAKLIKVERGWITLLRQGTQEEDHLLFEKNPEDLISNVKKPMKEDKSSGIQSVSSNRWVLDKREVSQAFENLPKLLTKARIIPNFNKGRANGFRIVSIVPNSIYEKIGLKNGDILQRINGIEIKDPQSFLKIFQQIKDETHISLNLVRNNQKNAFEYDIR